MRAHFGLPSISAEDAREWKAPIQVWHGMLWSGTVRSGPVRYVAEHRAEIL